MARRHRPARVAANPAAIRAVRAAQVREPWLPPGYLAWVAGRLIALGLLGLSAWGVYTFASSDRFDVRTVRVSGNVLLTQADVESTAEIDGMNLFWLNRSEVGARLRALPTVQRVEVSATLPDVVDIRVVERQPVGLWTSGDQTYLVDREGVILRAVNGETDQAHACAGQVCDPRLTALPSVAEVDGQSLTPGDRVDAGALSTSARLASLLPSVGIQPVGFNWSAEGGLEVPTSDGWSARFNESGNLDDQVAMLQAVRQQLGSTRTNAQLIDVRFGDRPYFR